MKDRDFIRIARLFGLADDEVGGRGLATPEPALVHTLRRFARGEVPRQDQPVIIAELLQKPELLGWFANCVKEANGESPGALLEREAPSDEATVDHDRQSLYDLSDDDDDDVVGHDSGDGPQLVCASCSRSFAIRGTPTVARVYVCRLCGAHNLAGGKKDARQWQGMPLPRIPQPYRPADLLDSLFLRGPGGSVYEVPRDLARFYKVSALRLKTLGHLPFETGPPPPDKDDEVGGRHMMPSAGGGASPGDWSFHRTWEYGCYFSVPANAYSLGYHRHPYGDERAVGASESDFA